VEKKNEAENPKSLLAIGDLLMVFRFGGPALICWSYRTGPFGNRRVAEGKIPTLLLDADREDFCRLDGIKRAFWA
jgi:hypothetical protein